MAKPDFPALLKPGLHSHTLSSLDALATVPFPKDSKRADLFHKLKVWASALQACHVRGTLWLDGSFLTEKHGPGDVDCVLWNPGWMDPAKATASNQQRVRQLLDKTMAETLYGLDLYVETPVPDQMIHREAYWKGFFGFCHDRVTAKGFAEVQL